MRGALRSALRERSVNMPEVPVDMKEEPDSLGLGLSLGFSELAANLPSRPFPSSALIILRYMRGSFRSLVSTHPLTGQHRRCCYIANQKLAVKSSGRSIGYRKSDDLYYIKEDDACVASPSRVHFSYFIQTCQQRPSDTSLDVSSERGRPIPDLSLLFKMEDELSI